MIRLSPADLVIIFTYFGAVLFVGFRTKRNRPDSEEEFLLAGRSLTLPVFVMTLVSTWYGGILGVGEFSYRFGISNWVVQGLPYYIFAALFAAFLTKKIRGTNLFTIPDKLEVAYDRRTALFGSVLTFVLMTPAPYVLMLSLFLQMLFGWSMLVCVAVTAVVAVSYLSVGGFRSDVQTDMLEFVLMFLGFAIILPFCIVRFGGFSFLQASLPPLHLTWHGGNSMQYILVWFFIALWTLVDPAFYQRCYAARDGATAQKGILISIAFWFLFDFLTATAGLYARAAIPRLDQPMMAYPALAEIVLPSVAKGVFYVGMLATIMSTLNTLAFVAAQTLGRDIVLRMKKHSRDVLPGQAGRYPAEGDSKDDSGGNIGGRVTGATRAGLAVAFLASAVLALSIPSVIQMWYTIGTVAIPGLLVPLVAIYFEGFRISARFAFFSMSAGSLVSLGWLLGGLSSNASGYPLGIEPMIPGLAAALLVWAAGRISQLRG